jgi:tetratricopeptide (TPR) repeat protein
MFVNYTLAESDPRLGAVYKNFGQNLKDIIAAGRHSGAKIVLSTVAVNLKDCAPFASRHRADLSESRLSEWQHFFDAGTIAQKSGDFHQAASDFDRAERIDENFAELRFRRGQCVLASNEDGAAQKEFAAARDLDALRFRCDSRLNDIIRQLAETNVALADGERVLAEASPDGIPGANFFYEHVHLTFQGNYVLARAIAEKVEKVLTLSDGASWPDIAQCAQRLGRTTRDTQLALSEILRTAQSAAEAALARWPDDAVLWEQLGEIKQAQGDYAGAVAAARRSLEQVPSSAQCQQLYGVLLAQEEKYEDAVAAFKHVFELDPQAVWARHNLALCLEKLGHRDEALVEFKRALTLKPDYGTGWLAMGQLYEEMGRTKNAEQCYNAALTNRINQADDLAALARFCVSRRWFGLAVTNFAAAIELSPSDAGLRLGAGRALVKLGRHEEAVRQYSTAVELDPDQAQAHMQLGVELGRLRKPALAEKEFRETLRVDPNAIDARTDLGIALYEEGRLDNALKEFADVLRRNPTDAAALRYVQLMTNK